MNLAYVIFLQNTLHKIMLNIGTDHQSDTLIETTQPLM